jgi:hypothetical protein
MYEILYIKNICTQNQKSGQTISPLQLIFCIYPIRENRNITRSI